MVLIIEKFDFTDLCPECNSNNIFPNIEKGEIVCTQCGLIVNEQIFDLRHSERRAYNKDEKTKKERTGTPISTLLPDISLCTFININQICNPDLKRVLKRDSYLSWKNQNLLNATTELKRISNNLSLPWYFKETALEIYKKAFKAKLLKGRSINSMVAASIYYICKLNHAPWTFQDILNETNLTQKKMKRSYNILIKKLSLNVPPASPIVFIPRYISKLGLPNNVEKIVRKMLQSYLKKYPINGINPKGLCAGTIYLVLKFLNLRINQRTIAELVGITEVTLRSRYNELLTKLNLFYP